MRYNTDILFFEKDLWSGGKKYIAGIDEVGRGPLAGPVFACAVVFEPYFFLEGVKDSKLMTAQKREKMAEILKSRALACACGSADQDEIDRVNIRQATFLAMRRALDKLKIKPSFTLIDGENLPGSGKESRGIIKGDRTSFTIAAASIIAKVTRDRLMCELDLHYPVYKFAKNKGYGTQEHIAAIRENGISPYHRKSFLSNILVAE